MNKERKQARELLELEIKLAPENHSRTNPAGKNAATTEETAGGFYATGGNRRCGRFRRLGAESRLSRRARQIPLGFDCRLANVAFYAA